MRSKLAILLFYSGVSRICFLFSRLFYGRQHIRVVNYHSTPTSYAANLEQHLAFYQKHYSNTTLQELNDFLATKIWKKDKPGLIISFDDGLKNNKECALPLLESYGFTGWLCIPTGYLLKKNTEKINAEEIISIYGIKTTAKEGLIMTPEELEQVSHKHEILCHTYTHMRLPQTVNDDATLNKELVQAKKELENSCGKKIEGFCWVGEELKNYSAKAHKIIKENYHFAFQTNNSPVTKKTDPYFIDRNNIEVWFSPALFLLTLSGLYDLMYWNKRKKLKKQLT